MYTHFTATRPHEGAFAHYSPIALEEHPSAMLAGMGGKDCLPNQRCAAAAAAIAPHAYLRPDVNNHKGPRAADTICTRALNPLNALHPMCDGEHSKQKTFRQPATPEAIRDLCGKHIASLEELLQSRQMSTTPKCLWEEETPAPAGHFKFSSQQRQPLTVRACLEHDHRCRSATALYDLATTCHRMADELSKTHKREMAELRKQLASVKRCVVEWEVAFGKDYSVTPATVGAELKSLRMQVADLKRENEALKARQAAFIVQHNSLAHYHDPLSGSMLLAGGVPSRGRNDATSSSFMGRKSLNAASRSASSKPRIGGGAPLVTARRQ